jgi:hypothetical protein
VPTVRQTSFAAGELSPRLWGRTDLELFGHGARKLRNIFVSPHGAAVSRPGTKLLAKAKTRDVVLVPFVFSETVSYVLEFGDSYVRIHSPSTGYTGVELRSPYYAEHLEALQWAQAGSVLTLTHPAREPHELRAPVPGVSATWVLVPARFSPPGNSPTDWQTMYATFRDVDGHYRLPPMLVSVPPQAIFTGDAQHPPREWRWKVSAIMRHNVTGEEIETVPTQVIEAFDGFGRNSVFLIESVDPASKVVVYPDRPVLLRHPTFGPLIGTLSGYSNWTPVGVVYYRGRGGLYGFIGTTRYAQDFVDVGDEPDYSRQPIRGVSPFETGEHPAAVAFFQQRRFYGGTPRRPSTLWASATDDWGNFDRPFPPYIPDNSAFETSFYARKRETVRSLVPHQRLLVLTDAGVWSLSGAGAPLSPSNQDFRLEDEVGATTLQPLIVDGAVLYVRAKGRGVRALSLLDNGAYGARDISWHAEHLFRGQGAQVVSWCFQRDPWATIWAVQRNGSLLSCVRTGEATWAWAKHTTDEGVDRFRSVCCVPESQLDVVVVAVTRNGETWLERMCARDVETTLPVDVSSSGDAAFAVDSAVEATGAVDAQFEVTGLDHLEGKLVWAVAPGNAPQGPLTVQLGKVRVGPFSRANTSGGAVKVRVGLRFVADLELLDAAEAGRVRQKNVVRVGFELDSAQGLLLGEDEQHLVPWVQRTVSDSYDFPSAASMLAVVQVPGSWRRTGRAFLRQVQPLPFTVLGVARDIDVGGA